MKIVLGFSIALLFCLTISCACHKLPPGAVQGTGTVKLLGLEGGFYGIVGDDGNNYDPLNLSDDFKIDGLKVQFVVRPAENQVSFHMWGKIVEVISIKKK
ncbi:MAG TPA: hypothetical protein VF399_03060 [bacterium]